MIKKEVLELKRRFKKDTATFTRLAGCYVDANKEKIHTFSHQFLTLEDEEYYKYLDIANKSLSGTLEDNLLNLEFPKKEEEVGGRQHILMALRDTRLEDEVLLNTFYDLVIDTYEHVGNYFIVLFHDAYDVMTRTTDNNNLDESEEVYSYIICAICPVNLSKPALGYLEAEKRIGSRIRDWVVGAPDTAVLFPALNERSTDIHSALFYTKNVKDPHYEFMSNGLGCSITRTVTEQKDAFQFLVKKGLESAGDSAEDVFVDVQKKLIQKAEDHSGSSEESLTLDKTILTEVLQECNVEPEQIKHITASVEREFGKNPPTAEHVIDEKAVKQSAAHLENKELEIQIKQLSNDLAESKEQLKEFTGYGKENTIHIHLSKDDEENVSIREVNGVKCVVIPVEEHILSINGKEIH